MKTSVKKSFLFIFILFCFACEKEVEPQKIGVFANTDKGMIELSYNQSDSCCFLSKSEYDQIPSVSNTRGFYVNIPSSQVAETKIRWFLSFKPDEKATYFSAENIETLKTDIEFTKVSNYKVTSPELNGKKGFIVVFIRMPLGTIDRQYLFKNE